jgi:hypothetical protein
VSPLSYSIAVSPVRVLYHLLTSLRARLCTDRQSGFWLFLQQ